MGTDGENLRSDMPGNAPDWDVDKGQQITAMQTRSERGGGNYPTLLKVLHPESVTNHKSWWDASPLPGFPTW